MLQVVVTAQVDVPPPSLSKPTTKDKLLLSPSGTGVSSHSVILVSESPEPEPEAPIPLTLDTIHILCWTLFFIRSQRTIAHNLQSFQVQATQHLLQRFWVEIVSGHTSGNLGICVNYSSFWRLSVDYYAARHLNNLSCMALHRGL